MYLWPQDVNATPKDGSGFEKADMVNGAANGLRNFEYGAWPAYLVAGEKEACFDMHELNHGAIFHRVASTAVVDLEVGEVVACELTVQF